MWRLKRRRKRIQNTASSKDQQAAQGLVEFALVLPILLLLMLGIIEFGRVLFTFGIVTAASREGARYAASTGDLTGSPFNYEDCAGIMAAVTRIGSLVGVENSDITIEYTIRYQDINQTITGCPPSEYVDRGDRIHVLVTRNFEPIVPLVNVPIIPISASTSRTLIRDVGIKGTPPTSIPLPTNTLLPSSTATSTSTATDIPTPTSTSQNTATVTPIGTGSLLLEKSASPLTYDEVGDEISYTYKVTNNGNITLYNIYIFDDNINNTVSCPDTSSGLAPGAGITCTVTYTITQADLDNGSVTNNANASDETDTVKSNADTVTVYAGKMLIEKTASPSTYDEVGDVIEYTYIVTNNGNITLYDISVSDDMVEVSCPDTASGLESGDNFTCTATFAITQADLDNGSITNNAYASDGTIQSNTASTTVTAVQTGSLLLEKTPNTAHYDEVGDIINYTYKLANNTNVTLFDITFEDDKASVICPSTSAGLAPEDSIICTASYTIIQDDLDNSSVTNNATATGYATVGTVQSNTASVTVTATIPPLPACEPAIYNIVAEFQDDINETLNFYSVYLRIKNASITSTLTITDLSFNWPYTSTLINRMNLTEIRFSDSADSLYSCGSGTTCIWNGWNGLPSYQTIELCQGCTEFFDGVLSDRQLGPGIMKYLKFVFPVQLLDGTYTVRIEMDNSCYIENYQTQYQHPGP